MDGLLDAVIGYEAGLLHDLSDQDHVGEGGEPVLLGQPGGGDVDRPDVGPLDLALDQRGIHEDGPARHHGALIFVQGGQVHDDQHVRMVHDRGAHGIVRQHHAAVGGAAPHLRAVGGEPAQLTPFQHSLLSQELPGEQDPLSAKASDQNLCGHTPCASFCALLSL